MSIHLNWHAYSTTFYYRMKNTKGDSMSQNMEENQYIAVRKEKANELKAAGVNPFTNGIAPTHKVGDILSTYQDYHRAALEEHMDEYQIAGRIMAIRFFGKAAFLKIKDVSGSIQIFFQKNKIGDEIFDLYKKKMDVGDIIAILGPLFRTKTDELTISARKMDFLTKSYRPLPEKWHGLTDIETRYRQRYVDLIVNDEVKDTFVKRSQVITAMRDFMIQHDFLEVETPMMHPIPGGAAAKPFITHHNKLDMDLYLRIAPELYLKRLIVGGLDRVFEINRNFRNEGISIKHNPEFTMMEFYQAYATFENLMDFTENMLTHVFDRVVIDHAQIEQHLHDTQGPDIIESTVDQYMINYQGTDINMAPPYRRIRLRDSLIEIGNAPADILLSKENALAYAKSIGETLASEDQSLDCILTELFEIIVEPKLIQPTFITHYPTDVSPLARRNNEDPTVTDRFEMFINGWEIANAFSELNDPEDQASRFHAQVDARDGGDEEAMHFDSDYIQALEHGMPPTAGEGIGVDRLVMLLTNQASIRDVILFPQLKKRDNKVG